jgi:Ca2+-dependent lipid-binding protein
MKYIQSLTILTRLNINFRIRVFYIIFLIISSTVILELKDASMQSLIIYFIISELLYYIFLSSHITQVSTHFVDSCTMHMYHTHIERIEGNIKL